MKKILATVVLAVPLTLGLVACGDTTTEDTAGSPAPVPSATAQAAPSPEETEHEVILGEENTFGEWTFTIEDATASQQCPHSEYSADEGTEYLLFSGHVQVSDEVVSTDHNPLTSGLRDVIMPDGTTQETIAMADCYPDNNSLKTWRQINEPGDNAHFLYTHFPQ